MKSKDIRKVVRIGAQTRCVDPLVADEIKRLQVHLDGVAQECKDALFREDLLREYKERYPPDYIEKLQQEIGELREKLDKANQLTIDISHMAAKMLIESGKRKPTIQELNDYLVNAHSENISKCVNLGTAFNFEPVFSPELVDPKDFEEEE